MNKVNDKSIVSDEHNSEFSYNENKSNLIISFERIAFIFFVFFIITLIFSIHLIHLGSRNIEVEDLKSVKQTPNKLYRADIVDRNKRYIVKTINSIDIGISPLKIIDQKNVRN